MAAAVPIPDGGLLVDIRCWRRKCAGDRIGDGELAGGAGGKDESGEIFARRMSGQAAIQSSHFANFHPDKKGYTRVES
jgi:hypothetical protein